ncbi:Structural maintenance of chromosomes protein 4 [Nymphaea thermarum]|nr:Structural maintenance of chromosomes protein 4 [Nymphaea thermarum]
MGASRECDETPAVTTDATPDRPSRRPRLFIKEMVLMNFKSYTGEQRIGLFHKGEVEQIFMVEPRDNEPQDEGLLEYRVGALALCCFFLLPPVLAF